MEAAERRGGCGFSRYGGGGGGGGGDADLAWKLGRILVRFRPIAPKPVAASPPVAGCAPELCVRSRRVDGRTKRKGAGRESRRGRKGRRVAGTFPEEKKEENYNYTSSSPCSSAAEATTVVTLPLMPETPERKREPLLTAPDRSTLCFQPGLQQIAAASAGVLRPAWSWVTVERVTETWREEEVGGRCSDEAVRRSLEGDSCPGFGSDEWDRVTWTNAAYGRMVVDEEEGTEGEEEEEMRVALETKGMVPVSACRAFSCMVTVRYPCRRSGRVTLAAPCDVWRLGGGGHAWRLDVKAVLSLGSVR